MKKFLLPIAKFLNVGFTTERWSCNICGRHPEDISVPVRYVQIKYGQTEQSTTTAILCEPCASEMAFKIQTLLLNH